MNWTFTVAGEYFILKSTVSGETFFFLKKKTRFQPDYTTDEILFDCIASNLKKRIKRTEVITPGPGSGMTNFLDSIISLLA
jgi:hypothetical protein